MIANPARKTSILIVEDEETTLLLLTELFAAPRYEVRTASSAREAARSLDSWRPDLAILDISLPDQSGFEVLRAMRMKAAFDRVPVLMLSGHRSENMVREARQNGANGFMVKPFTPAALVDRVDRLLAMDPDIDRMGARAKQLRLAAWYNNRSR